MLRVISPRSINSVKVARNLALVLTSSMSSSFLGTRLTESFCSLTRGTVVELQHVCLSWVNSFSSHNRATLLLGLLPQELLGTSMYEYYHVDDIVVLTEAHKASLQTTETITTPVCVVLALTWAVAHRFLRKLCRCTGFASKKARTFDCRAAGSLSEIRGPKKSSSSWQRTFTLRNETVFSLLHYFIYRTL